MKRKLRMGMIGGGKDAFIGSIHRYASNMDGLVELVCGALSINPEIAKDSGQSLFLPEDRIYLTYQEMIESTIIFFKQLIHRYCYLSDTIFSNQSNIGTFGNEKEELIVDKYCQ